VCIVELATARSNPILLRSLNNFRASKIRSNKYTSLLVVSNNLVYSVYQRPEAKYSLRRHGLDPYLYGPVLVRVAFVQDPRDDAKCDGEVASNRASRLPQWHRRQRNLPALSLLKSRYLRPYAHNLRNQQNVRNP
jgi:hypothetical protein